MILPHALMVSSEKVGTTLKRTPVLISGLLVQAARTDAKCVSFWSQMRARACLRGVTSVKTLPSLTSPAPFHTPLPNTTTDTYTRRHMRIRQRNALKTADAKRMRLIYGNNTDVRGKSTDADNLRQCPALCVRNTAINHIYILITHTY